MGTLIREKTWHLPVDEINGKILHDTEEAHTEVGERQVGQEKVGYRAQTAGESDHQYHK